MNGGPLSGYRIIDLSRVLSGPAATMLLADQGADVIKIEPIEGDITRGMGTAAGNMTAFFLNVNRGKRGLALDLKSPEGQSIVRRLIGTADVVVQNFRPGVVEKMGLGYADATEIKEDIVYVSISGFGTNGPYANKRVYDPVIQALSGMTDIQADHIEKRPTMMRTVIPDKTTALTAAQAITAALLARERTKLGQHVELAMLDATISFMWPEAMMRLTVVGDEPDAGIGQIAQDLVFRTADGYITVSTMSDDQWKGLCQVVERLDWIDDPRFSTTASRFDNMDERLREVSKVLLSKRSDEWLPALDAHGVPSAPILSRVEVLDHPQVQANNIVQSYEHPMLGEVRQPRPAARLDNMPEQPVPKAPLLGEHNYEILQELGFSEEAISDLQSNNVIYGSCEKT